MFPQQHGYNPTGTVGVLAYWSARLKNRGRSSMRKIFAAAGAALFTVGPAGAAFAADAAHGKQVFATCAACHSDKSDAIGPSLKGVYGRKSGSLPDFRYSKTP